jgi:hypothetical protein
MTTEDVAVMNSVRRDVYRDIVDMLMETNGMVPDLSWWDWLRMDRDMTVNETWSHTVLLIWAVCTRRIVPTKTVSCADFVRKVDRCGAEEPGRR